MAADGDDKRQAVASTREQREALGREQPLKHARKHDRSVTSPASDVVDEHADLPARPRGGRCQVTPQQRLAGHAPPLHVRDEARPRQSRIGNGVVQPLVEVSFLGRRYLLEADRKNRATFGTGASRAADPSAWR